MFARIHQKFLVVGSLVIMQQKKVIGGEQLRFHFTQTS